MYRRIMTITVVPVFVTITTMASVPDAYATQNSEVDGPRAQQLYLEGMAMYRVGKYRSAIRSFEEAYRTYPDPKLMYNLARSYEAIGNSEAAAGRYRKVLSDPEAEYDLQKKARKRLKLVERALQRSAAAPAEEGPAASFGGRKDARDGGTTWIGVAKWVSGGLGIGLLAGGAVVLGLGMSNESELDDARTDDPTGVSGLTRVQAADLADRAEKRQTTGVILLSAGAAMAAATLALFLVDLKGDGDKSAADTASETAGKSRLAFGMTPLSQGAALTVGGAF